MVLRADAQDATAGRSWRQQWTSGLLSDRLVAGALAQNQEAGPGMWSLGCQDVWCDGAGLALRLESLMTLNQEPPPRWRRNLVSSVRTGERMSGRQKTPPQDKE